MAKEYIEREALRKKIFPYEGIDKAKYAINAKAVEAAINGTPAADVVEVKHGKWKEIAVLFFGLNVPEAECTVCGESWTLDMRVDFETIKNCWHYCPNCGAKMDGERKDER